VQTEMVGLFCLGCLFVITKDLILTVVDAGSPKKQSANVVRVSFTLENTDFLLYPQMVERKLRASWNPFYKGTNTTLRVSPS
jgi:hypothetical protein